MNPPEPAASLFAPVLDRLLAALPATAVVSPPPAGFARQEAVGVTLRAHRVVLPGLGEVRAVHLAGPRAEIVNLFFFPVVSAPVFAMEFVAFGKKPVVAVIDLKGHAPESAALARRILRAAHARHPTLGRGSDAPAWFAECRSGDDFFVRPADLAEFDRLAVVLDEIWRELLAALPARPPTTPAEARAGQDYRDHHRAHSPGRPFLHRIFGADWTERFMAGFLFAPV